VSLGLPKTFALSPYAAKAGAARLVFGNFSYLAIRHNNYFFKIPSSEKKASPKRQAFLKPFVPSPESPGKVLMFVEQSYFQLDWEALDNENSSRK